MYGRDEQLITKNLNAQQRILLGLIVSSASHGSAEVIARARAFRRYTEQFPDAIPRSTCGSLIFYRRHYNR